MRKSQEEKLIQAISEQDWFDLASFVVYSPYFTMGVDTDDREEIIAFANARRQEKAALVDAISKAKSFADLDDEMKELFTRAFNQVEATEDDNDTWVGRIIDRETQNILSDEALALIGPTADQSNLLVLAMIEATEKGDTDTAEKLAELAKDPGLLQQIMDGDFDTEEEKQPPEKQPKQEEKKKTAHPAMKPSPFRKRKFFRK